jgi:predicted outer membrane protein
MSAYSFTRSSTLALALAALCAVGCKRAGDDDGKPLVIDSSGGGVADRDPNTTANTVMALLTDANVFAVLDTSYAMIISVDSIGQANAQDARVREFAQHAISQNALARSGIKTTADRLNIAPALPSHHVIRDRLHDIEKLRGEKGTDFDEDYLERVIDSRKDMIDDIDDALDAKGIQQNASREFLREVRANLDADRRQATAIKDALKK